MSEASNAFSRLFATNDAPNLVEVGRTRPEIDQYNLAIRNNVQLELQKLEAGQAKYHGLLSSARCNTIPLELLGEIFGLVLEPIYIALDKCTELIKRDVEKGRNALIDICMVCRAWRDAAYATPSLRARLDLHWDSLSFEAVVKWFGRLKGIPKSLILHPRKYTDGNADEHFATLTKILTQGPPLDHLYLNMILPSGKPRLQSLAGMLEANTSDGAPQTWETLKSFGVQFDGSDTDPSEAVVPAFPNLTSLELKLPYFYQIFPWDGEQLVPFNISQSTLARITTLTLTDCDWSDWTVLGLVRWCTNLDTLTVTYSRRNFHWKPEPVEYPPSIQDLFRSGVVLSALRTLRLQHLCGVNIIMRHLRLPSLVELDLNYSYDNEAAYHNAESPGYPSYMSLETDFQAIVMQCKPTLRRLRLRGLSLQASRFSAILFFLPFITHLTLDNMWFESAIFKRLEAARAECLPHLEVLELTNICKCFHVPDLYAFVASRSFGKLDTSDSEPERTMASLKELTLILGLPESEEENRSEELCSADEMLRDKYGIVAKMGVVLSELQCPLTSR